MAAPIWPSLFRRAGNSALGAHIYKALTKNLTVCEGADGKVAMRALVDRLAPADLKKDATPNQDGVTIDVIDLKLPNALALPGDHVLVTSGLDRSGDLAGYAVRCGGT